MAAPLAAQEPIPAPPAPSAETSSASSSDGPPSPPAETDVAHPGSDAEVPSVRPSVAQSAGAQLDEPPSEADAEDEGDGLPAWLRGFSLMAFVDGYAQGVWTLPNPFGGDQSAVLSDRAYTFEGGLTISFAGFDLSYRYESVGARLDIRLGTSMPHLLGAFSGLPPGVRFMKQAFVYWRPLENFEIDFGEFDTIYGAEVSESWRNPTYSRGALYNLVQPFYHTGFRAIWSPVESLTFTALAVNGWNNIVDNNNGKTFGGQVSWSVDHLQILAGYLGGPEGPRDDLWRHLADVVVKVTVDDLELVTNGDYVAEDQGNGTFSQLWGVMLSGRLRIHPVFAVAARGEVIGYPDSGNALYTATLTLETTPVDQLVIRLDNRVDYATDPRFENQQARPSRTVVSTILGVVVHSN